MLQMPAAVMAYIEVFCLTGLLSLVMVPAALFDVRYQNEIQRLICDSRLF